jgi:predicted DNA-binding transcriptional regulator AlpA|tara:strand:+ start:638 stop:841 length:204 start_codon:yes stop_codon:yes gene_type:complete
MNLLKPKDVSAKLGMTPVALRALRRREDTFPQPIKVSQKVYRWDEADIDSWLTAKKERVNGEDYGIG